MSKKELSRPSNFNMIIQGGMLEALGLNMYSTLGKCLVEFVANAYDAEAKKVEISIPFDDIVKAREYARELVKKDIKNGKKEKASILTLPLPNEIEVTIKDDGHGMSPEDIEKKFLPFNRNRRREDNNDIETKFKSENGKRQVMGRKGLGKLAGFGTAELVTIKTKRKGYSYATEITLDYAKLKKENLSDTKIDAKYIDNLAEKESWTEIKLGRLKCDAVRFGEDAIKATLADNFYGIDSRDFAMLLNDEPITQPKIDYEYFYPHRCDTENLFKDFIEIEGLSKINFKYVVMFRKRGEHVPASKRGARIYCLNRLAAGPSLFTLPTGMHGFHNISYMECIVNADDFDHLGIDLINTNRTQLKEDNEAVSRLLEKIVENMKSAVANHAKFRDEKAEKDIEITEQGKILMKIVDRLPVKQRTSARAILKRLSADYGAESKEFHEVAPLFVNTVNAGEVLIRLIDLGTDAETIPQIAEALHELAEIEKTDALKLYRARKDGIYALTSLIQRGKESWGKKGIESELHALLKKAPWLISPEYGRYMTSNNNLETLYSRMAQDLKIDNFALPEDDVKEESDKKRPDLVFVTGSAHSPTEVIVVELKSTSIHLTDEHLRQLENYMNRIEDWCAQYSGNVNVKGLLIGRLAPVNSRAEGPYNLFKRMKKSGPNTLWAVRDIEHLVNAAMKIHLEEIKTIIDELPEENALKAVMQK